MNEKHLSVWGIGPVYVITIIIITIVTMLLQLKGSIITYKFIDDLFAIIVGIAFIVLGIILWISAVVFSKLTKKIKSNFLITTGVFAYVRNPIYSAFMFICTGVIITLNNLVLLIIPILYWALLTILLINTEEKWLRKLYKDEYDRYCKTVNRCIPMIRKYRDLGKTK